MLVSVSIIFKIISLFSEWWFVWWALEQHQEYQGNINGPVATCNARPLAIPWFLKEWNPSNILNSS